jgi:hypothetical protein
MRAEMYAAISICPKAYMQGAREITIALHAIDAVLTALQTRYHRGEGLHVAANREHEPNG